MKIDAYTKVVLTIIAIALWGILLTSILNTNEVSASSGIVDVNIKEIDGRPVYNTLDVNIKKINGIPLVKSSILVVVSE